MTPVKEPAVLTTAYQLYLQNAFQQAYDLLSQVVGRYPAYQREVYQWRVCMLCRLEQLDRAEALLKEALDAEVFFSEYSLREDEDLRALQGRPLFEALVSRDLEMLAVARLSAHPQLAILESAENLVEHPPLLMALHGNHSSIERFQGYWDKLAEKGWLVALPQSSQV